MAFSYLYHRSYLIDQSPLYHSSGTSATPARPGLSIPDDSLEATA
jgi:hypothetical protein